jgi:RNA polymerase sigma factor (sigma-70 family)
MRTPLTYDYSQTRPLPDTEIRELIRQTRDGALTKEERDAAQWRIILSNSGWRHKLAMEHLRQWAHPRPDAEDLANHAIDGEIRAIRKFDLTRLTKYITYETVWVKQSFQRMLQEQYETVYRPAHAMTLGRRIDRIRASTKMPESSVADMLAIKPRRHECSVKARAWTSSIEDQRDADGRTSPLEPAIWDVDHLEAEEQVELLRKAIASLEPRQRLVIEQRLERRTMTVIGKVIGVTKERVRQIEISARRNIRDYMEANS